MSEKFHNVLFVQDASKEPRTSGIKWALDGLSLKPHDKMTLLGIIQPFKSASSSPPPMGCGILMGYKSKLESTATLKLKQETVDHGIAQKLDEYRKNADIREIQQLYEMQQIEFQIIVEAGHSLKDVAVKAARKLGATCVVLERQMKKDKKYFMENLTCGIIRLKHENCIENLREPKAAEMKIIDTDRGHSIRRRTQGRASDEPESSIMGEQQKEIIMQRSICSVCTNQRPRIRFLEEFTLAELEIATNYFSLHNLVSKGEKQVYRGQLSNGIQIVVKEHSFYSNMVRKHTAKNIKEKEFKSEVQILSRVRHENLAMLLGSCSEDGNRLLVYEYVCHGSLDQYLSSKKNEELTWDARLKIAAGAAKGLEYLHKKEIYGNVRPNNILITHEYQALLGNFGLTRRRNKYEESEDHSSEDSIMTTFEYVAPEYEETGNDSSKSDVYSFGVVLLELITGRRTLEDTCGQSFLRWARPLLKEKNYGDLIDPKVLKSHDLHQLFWMVRVVEICLSLDPDRRYSIDQVAIALECIIQGLGVEVFSPPDSI